MKIGGILPGGKENYRRVFLAQSNPGTGGFAAVMGETTIELSESLDRKGQDSYSRIGFGQTQELLIWDLI